MFRIPGSGALALALSLALSACGGSGGGGVGSAPNPSPAPTPSPTPTAPLAPDMIGIKSNVTMPGFAASATYPEAANGGASGATDTPARESVSIRYNAAQDVYLIDLPGFAEGEFKIDAYSGTAGQKAISTYGTVAGAAGLGVTLAAPGGRLSPYTYSSFGRWSAKAGSNLVEEGWFAYGIPATALPASGSATYTAAIWGTQLGPSGFEVGGDVKLTFNFAGGSLSGSMHPKIFGNGFGPDVDFGEYTLAQTLFNSANGTFSGKFTPPAGASGTSGFGGMLTGPGGAEVIANWVAPYAVNGDSGYISGIWIGKKD